MENNEIQSFEKDRSAFISEESSLMRKILIRTCAFCLTIFCIGFLIYKNFDTDRANPIRSDSIIPAKIPLLERPRLIEQIEQKLKGGSNSQTVFLVGMGGVGKTTVARQFGYRTKASVVWELNAETQGQIVSSLFGLGYALTKTQDQKNDLDFIQSIQNQKEKENRLLCFINKHLKNKPKWLLIYDNVATFSDIQEYIPKDVNTKGQGKIIITTQNAMIQNTAFENPEHVIHLDELSKEEALAFFTRILFDRDPQSLTQNQRDEATRFLVNIPPFPLDVSTAAYYIKNTQIPYDQYLEKIKHCSQEFEKTQTSLRRDMTCYTKTRHGIIRLSFQRLIEYDPQFKELLLLICFLDSQDIPKDLLEFYKNSALVESFMQALKKYSLIMNESPKENEIAMISLHRSTQILGQAYLLDLLNETERALLINKMLEMVQSFCQSRTKKNQALVRASIPHLKAFLKTVQTTNLSKKSKDKHTQDLLLTLGYAYMRCSRNIVLERRYFIQAHQLQNDTKHFTDKKLATLLKDLASTCADLECTDESIMYAKKSLKISETIPQSDGLVVENLRILGYAYTYKNDFKQAQFYLEKALKRTAKLKGDARNELESNIYAQLGWLYSVTYITGHKAAEAKKYIHKALELLNGNDIFYGQVLPLQRILPRHIAQHKTTLGSICCMCGDYEEAINQGYREAQFIIDHSLDNCQHHLLKVYIAIGMGEAYLRSGRVEAAKIKFIDALQESEKIAGKESILMVSPQVFCAEAHIRLGDFSKAYDCCLSALKIKTNDSTNYSKLMHSLAHYHAALIKYKQGDARKSFEHFGDFLKEMKIVGESFFDKNTYDTLIDQNVFEIPENKQDLTSNAVQDCLQKSNIILTHVYGPSHPFIRDFILKNEGMPR